MNIFSKLNDGKCLVGSKNSDDVQRWIKTLSAYCSRVHTFCMERVLYMQIPGGLIWAKSRFLCSFLMGWPCSCSISIKQHASNPPQLLKFYPDFFDTFFFAMPTSSHFYLYKQLAARDNTITIPHKERHDNTTRRF